MRYRALTPDGDYPFGHAGVYLVDSPQAVAQAISTRLKLWAGEWFLDSEEGTPYMQHILGMGTSATRDIAIKSHILGTQGVKQIISYKSSLDGPTRKFSVECLVDTIYGAATVNALLG